MIGTAGAVYKVIKSPDGKGYTMIHYLPAFKLPPKVYGDIPKLAERFWKGFAFSKNSLGALLTGSKGSGKTEFAKYFSNIAIANNMPVVLVSEIETNIELVNYLNDLSNVVLILEEFGKNFNRDLQDKMLTMLSVVNGKKKFFIITENNRYAIADFILDRPGRIHYNLDFNRISLSVIKEYCEDMGVDEPFYKELIRRYEKIPKFQFDHMEALVKEHLAHPEDSFDYLIEIMNIKFMNVIEYYYLSNLKNISKGYNCVIDSETMRSGNERGYTYNDISDGRTLYFTFLDYDITEYNKNTEKALESGDPNAIMMVNRTLPPSKHVQFTKDHITNISRDEEYITLSNGNYEATLELKRSQM